MTKKIIAENDMADGQRSSVESEAFSGIMLACGVAEPDKKKALAAVTKMWNKKLGKS